MKYIKSYLLIIILSLTACGAKINNFSVYEKQPILTSDLFNEEDLKINLLLLY